MAESETSFSKKAAKGSRAKGLRCQVCTGCGLCPGVQRKAPEGMRILTQDLMGGKLSLKSEDGIRLAAADLGTTTIAMELFRADGSVEERFVLLNPQAEFGADVLSRIQAAKDPAARKKMKEMVRSALAQGAERFLKCLLPEENMVMVIAANTTMSYLLMGWDPQELGQAPFEATHLAGARFELDGIHCLLLPGFSAFVGGDLLAGAVAASMAEKEEVTLLVDLGTNGEILIGNKERILGTATAAGPAFEGGAGRGVFGADLVKCVARLREEGFLDETGLLAQPYFETGILVGNLRLSKEAVRSLQVAKAAILAGIQIVTRQYGIAMEEISQVILAGGFGYFLDPADAVRIGLLPACLEKKAISGGNTALAGAKRVGAGLLQKEFWELEPGKLLKTETVWKDSVKVEVINLALQEDFPERYLAAMTLDPA